MHAHPSASRRQRLAQWLRREVLPLAVMLLLLGMARTSLANHYQVPTGSMQPNLQPGDRVVVDMRAYGVRVPFTERVLLEVDQPQAGDVAVFDSPADGVRLIKRVVAVAGDRVELRSGRLTVNGRAMAAGDSLEWIGPRLAQLELAQGGGPDIDGVIVPQGQVLVLGDHRGNSVDSRWFGFVPARALYGRAVAVYWRRDEGLSWKRL